MQGIIECRQSSAKPKNTGAKEQCLVGPVLRHFLASTSQEFDTATNAKTLSTWRTAEKNKEIIPLYELEALANANTESTYYEGRKKYKTKEGKKIVTYECHLGICSYAALYSYNGNEMRVYEFTDDQKIVGVTPDGTKVRGQLIKIEVGLLIPATDEKPQYCVVTLTFEDFNEFVNAPVILSPSWSHIELQGVFDTKLTLESATSTSIKFKANAGCAGEDLVKVFEDTDVVLLDASGAAYTHSFVAADADGIYELTGTAFANDFTVNLNGVVQKTEATYESIEALTISGI